MASSSGNSSGSTEIHNSGSEGDLQLEGVMDQRKRKRMQSNRESARRSRMRKQKHLDDLVAQVAQLGKVNSQIRTTIGLTTQQFLTVEAENSVLRAQMMELSQRLDSLNDILNYMNANNEIYETAQPPLDHHHHRVLTGHGFGLDGPESFMNNPWNLMYANQQSIMASADIFQY